MRPNIVLTFLNFSLFNTSCTLGVAPSPTLQQREKNKSCAQSSVFFSNKFHCLFWPKKVKINCRVSLTNFANSFHKSPQKFEIKKWKKRHQHHLNKTSNVSFHPMDYFPNVDKKVTLWISNPKVINYQNIVDSKIPQLFSIIVTLSPYT
jgi:hypothetical protein